MIMGLGLNDTVLQNEVLLAPLWASPVKNMQM